MKFQTRRSKNLAVFVLGTIVWGIIVVSYLLFPGKQRQSPDARPDPESSQPEAVIDAEDLRGQIPDAQLDAGQLDADQLERWNPDLFRTPAEVAVVLHLVRHGELPDTYVTKSAARAAGWVAEQGNLGEVAPGKSIGGDRFYNREGRLPDDSGRTWYEADLNYDGGRRGAERLVYSNDGLIYLTRDHYRTFEKVRTSP